MTSERMRELRFTVWAIAQRVLTDTANRRAALPFRIDEEYEYARKFMLEIAKRTLPGDYHDDDEDGQVSCKAQLKELLRKRTLICEEFALAGPGENQWRSRLMVELAEIEAQINRLGVEYQCPFA